MLRRVIIAILLLAQLLSCKTVSKVSVTPQPEEKKVPVYGIFFSQPRTLSTEEGETISLTPQIRPVDATDKRVAWVSSDTTVVKVDNTGRITAVGGGWAVIAAASYDGHYTNRLFVDVYPSDYCYAEENGHQFVDLGLPSGTKWARCNVGALSPEESGDYYSWGETEPKDVYYWSTYKWNKGDKPDLTKYNTDEYRGIVDNKTKLDPEDDVAQVKWGGTWRMPTLADFNELVHSCYWIRSSLYGKDGFRVVSRSNGRSIFFPITGGRWGDSFIKEGGSGYWSSSLNSKYSTLAKRFCDYDLFYLTTDAPRCYGLAVRPVTK